MAGWSRWVRAWRYFSAAFRKMDSFSSPLASRNRSMAACCCCWETPRAQGCSSPDSTTVEGRSVGGAGWGTGAGSTATGSGSGVEVTAPLRGRRLDSLPVADGLAALRVDVLPVRRVDFLEVAGAASCAEATGAQHVTSA